MGHRIEEKLLPQCPFWKNTNRRSSHIGCEGLTDHSRITLTFETGQECCLHENVFCCAHYSYCEIYNAIWEAKYAGEDA